MISESLVSKAYVAAAVGSVVCDPDVCARAPLANTLGPLRSL